MKNVLIIGGNQGIGRSMAELLQSEHRLIVTSRSFNELTEVAADSWQVHCDLSDENAITQLYPQLQQQVRHIDWVINCAGVLHNDSFQPEKTFKQCNFNQFETSFKVNCWGHLQVIKSIQPLLIKAKNPIMASLSARIGSIEDNRLGGWYTYRMSKAALNMGFKTLGIEWSRMCPSAKLMLLHPGTTDTALSKPFQKNLPNKQIQSPVDVARKLINQITAHAKSKQQGTVFIDYAGKQIPW